MTSTATATATPLPAPTTTAKGPKPTKPPKGKAEPEKVQECDPTQFSAREAQGRVAEVYRLQKALEGALKKEAAAKAAATAATEARKKAERILADEIREQRFGQGNLFDK